MRIERRIFIFLGRYRGTQRYGILRPRAIHCGGRHHSRLSSHLLMPPCIPVRRVPGWYPHRRRGIAPHRRMNKYGCPCRRWQRHGHWVRWHRHRRCRIPATHGGRGSMCIHIGHRRMSIYTRCLRSRRRRRCAYIIWLCGVRSGANICLHTFLRTTHAIIDVTGDGGDLRWHSHDVKNQKRARCRLVEYGHTLDWLPHPPS